MTLCCENPFDVLAIGDGVDCCEQSGAYRLVLHWSLYMYYRNVLLHQQLLLAIRNLSGDFFTSLQDNAPAHRARETVQLSVVKLWNTRLHRSSSVASQQSWPELNPDIPDLVEAPQPDAWRWPAEVKPDRRVETFHQVFIDEAIKQWRPHPRTCIQAHGGHFKHKTLFIYSSLFTNER